jgi:hypothetical protein
MIRTLLACAVVLLLAGCSHTRVAYKDVTYERWSFLQNTAIGEVTADIKPDGSATVGLKNLTVEERLAASLEALATIISQFKGAAPLPIPH